MTNRRRRPYNPDFYPLPDYLQLAVERNIGQPPVWAFPPLSPSPEGLTFERLDFESRHHLLETFQNDGDIWVDKRFKTSEAVYEYVAMQCIELPYSRKHGGCDWLVFPPEGACAGVLHMFEFSKERFAHHHRKCAVGFAFNEKYRGTPLPSQAVRHLQHFLFEKMDLLYLAAWTQHENKRCCSFLEKLGWLDCTHDYENPDESRCGEPKYRHFELYRSGRTRAVIQRQRSG